MSRIPATMPPAVAPVAPTPATRSEPAEPPTAMVVDSPAELLTTQQAAKFLGVSDATLRKWVREGLLPEVRVGRKLLRFDPNDLIAVVRKSA